MPEGPEVRRCAESIYKKIGNGILMSMEINDKSRYYKTNGFPGMNNLELNSVIQTITVKGKRIIFHFKTPSGKDIYLLSFLGMEGHWLIKPGKHSGIQMVFKTLKRYNKTILSMSTKLYYDDSRHFGRLEVFDSQENLNAFLDKTVGPDLLNETIPFEQYKKVITSKRIRNKQIVEFLMNQKYFSGIGNYLKSEVLYASKLSPQRLLQSLSQDDIERLFSNSIRILNESYQKGGLTIATYTDVEGNFGTFETKVYSKSTSPEGYSIRQDTFKDKRTTFWVSEIQV